MALAPLSAGFQSLPPLPTIKLGPSGVGFRVGELVTERGGALGIHQGRVTACCYGVTLYVGEGSEREQMALALCSAGCLLYTSDAADECVNV